ncbi:MAG TPA: DM13 domain-containing protein [Dehalococcoidia bacterium]
MDIAGDLERFLSEDLYPYRYPLTIGFAVAFVAALAVAYRLGWHLVAWRHRLITGPALVIFLVVAIPVGNYLLSPLWERSTVCEASPIPGASSGSEKCDDVVLASTNSPTATPGETDGGSTPASAATDAPTAAPTATGNQPTASPTQVPAAGTDAPTPVPTEAPTPGFEPHVVLQGEFEGADDFHFGEGTALLIESEPGEYVLRFEDFSVRNGPDLFVYLSPNAGGYDDAAINLGELKGTDGAFNYDISAGTDITQYKSAIVWCKAFSVLFATATFGPAS